MHIPLDVLIPKTTVNKNSYVRFHGGLRLIKRKSLSSFLGRETLETRRMKNVTLIFITYLFLNLFKTFFLLFAKEVRSLKRCFRNSNGSIESVVSFCSYAMSSTKKNTALLSIVSYSKVIINFSSLSREQFDIFKEHKQMTTNLSKCN